jgi:hypothetical protein
MVPWRTIFFGVNCAACLGWIVIAVLWLAEGSQRSIDLFSAVVGVVIAAPAAAIAVGEWLLFARGKQKLERPLGIVAGLVGALALFALVANAGEAFVKGGSPGALFWLGFGSVCLAISAYGFWCCWLRVRRQTLLLSRIKPRGNSVE